MGIKSDLCPYMVVLEPYHDKDDVPNTVKPPTMTKKVTLGDKEVKVTTHVTFATCQLHCE